MVSREGTEPELLEELSLLGALSSVDGGGSRAAPVTVSSNRWFRSYFLTPKVNPGRPPGADITGCTVEPASARF